MAARPWESRTVEKDCRSADEMAVKTCRSRYDKIKYNYKQQITPPFTATTK
jgi:hypothetical protein